MIDVFLYISNGLIVLGFLWYFVFLFIGKYKNIGEVNGFDVTKDVISEYDRINVIEHNGYFTLYNIKRGVIKIASSKYYGSNISAIVLCLFEAGISIVFKNGNKLMDILKNVISNLKLLYILPIALVFINSSTFNVSDVKVSIILLMIFIYIAYMVWCIKGDAINYVDLNIKKVKGINKKDKDEIIKYMNYLLVSDKLIYFGEIMMIFRFVLILFDVKF